MCKKLSCLAIALIVAGAVILVGTTIGLSVYFANKVVEEEDKGNPGKVTTPTGPVPGPPGPKPPAPPGPQPPAPPGPQPPAPPGPQPPAPKPVVWVGGPQNEVKGLPELLGTEFIEYKRDYAQWKNEEASRLATSSKDLILNKSRKLNPSPLRIHAGKVIAEAFDKSGESDAVAAEKRVREVVDAAVARWSGEGGNGVAQLRFVAETVHAEGKPESKRMIKVQNLAHELISTGTFAAREGAKVKPSEIAIVVSADASRAGGVTSKLVDDKPAVPRRFSGKQHAPKSQAVSIEMIHNGHDDPEGSLLSNWYVHQAGGFPRTTLTSGNKDWNAQAKKVVALFGKLLANKWGFKNPPSSDKTYQGVDYVNSKNPMDFGDCWVVRKPKIGEEQAGPKLFGADGKQDNNVPAAHAKKSYPMGKGKVHEIGAFLFVPTPIAARHGEDRVNKLAQTNFSFFLASLQASVAAALDAAIQEQLVYGKGVKVLAFQKLAASGWPEEQEEKDKRKSGPSLLVGGGASVKNYREVIDAALDEMVKLKGVPGYAEDEVTLPKRAFFEDVVMTHDGQS